MSPTVCTSPPGAARRGHTDHFGTTPEVAKWLAHPRYASAFPPAASAGSPTFYMRLPPRQRRWEAAAPVRPHSASGGDAHARRPPPYESPDAEGSASASDTAPPAPCRRPQAHRAAPPATLQSVPDTGECLHHRRLPGHRREASRPARNRAPLLQRAVTHPESSRCPPRHRLLCRPAMRAVGSTPPAPLRSTGS